MARYTEDRASEERQRSSTAPKATVEFIGLAQALAQFSDSTRNFQSNCWANLKIWANPVDFRLQLASAPAEVVKEVLEEGLALVLLGELTPVSIRSPYSLTRPSYPLYSLY
jgi:hypothetical protein